jgi:feruloyl esterase
MPWINAQVVAACDAADGVTDGVIANPRVCNFRPEQLLCKYFPANSTCLNVAQVETLENLYRDYYETNNTYIFPAYEKGSEGMWPLTLSGNSWNLQPAYYAYQVLNVSLNDWDPYTLNYSTIELAQYINPWGVICDVPDLTPYFNRNGKIIHYHGWADGLISSRSSVDYYNTVDRTLSGNFSDNYRLFMVPGTSTIEFYADRKECNIVQVVPVPGCSIRIPRHSPSMQRRICTDS